MSTSTTSNVSARENLRGTMMTFSAIVAGVFLFMLVTIFIGQTNQPLIHGLDKYERMITWGIALFSLTCLGIARVVLMKGVAAAKNSLKPLQDKLRQYRFSLIRYLVICEVPALLSIMLFMLTGNFIFQLFAAVFLGFMLAVAPIRRRVIAALELNGLEQSELE
jgi:hypothetical protein